MTTGEKLLTLSTLPNGTAIEHFMSITINPMGNGTSCMQFVEASFSIVDATQVISTTLPTITNDINITITEEIITVG